jgi:MULE transposase domain
MASMMKCASMELCTLKHVTCTSTHVCPCCELNVHAVCGEICDEASLKFQTTCFKCFGIYGTVFTEPAAFHEFVREIKRTDKNVCEPDNQMHDDTDYEMPCQKSVTGRPVRLTPAETLQGIDSDIQIFRESAWEALLPFTGYMCREVDYVADAGNSCYNNELDLFAFVRMTSFKNGGITIRFDPGVYNVINGWRVGSDGQKLLTALCAASQKNGGCELKCNGGTKKGSNRKELMCAKHRPYDKNSYKRKEMKGDKPVTNGPFRESTFHCDKKNTRGGEGQSMKRRRNTSRAKTITETCNVNLILGYDEKTYFMRCGHGTGIHKHHLPVSHSDIAVRAKFVDESMIAFQKQLAIANIQPAQTAAALHAACGTSLTRRQVAYHQGFSKLAHSLASAVEMTELGKNCSDLDLLIEILKRKEAGFCALYHRTKLGSASELPKPKNMTVNNETTLGDMLITETGGSSNGESVLERVMDTDNMGEDLMQYARESRVSVKAKNDQDVLLAIVWVLPRNRELFRAYPEVLFIDGTHKTNYENRPLITMGIKDSHGNVQVVLRAFVPNERAWLFRWLFQVATPALLGAKACEDVQLLITDGDAQETSQLDDAVITVRV